MAFDWMGLVKGLAPTVASALGGPLAGGIVTAIGGILGISEPTQDKISEALETGKMTPDQIAEIKKLELQLKAQEKELGFKFEELEFKDRDSARQMQIATRSEIPGYLAIAIVGGFFFILTGMGTGLFEADNNQPMLVMLGALGTAFVQVLSYYFGSTSGSSRKTELLAQASAVKNGQ